MAYAESQATPKNYSSDVRNAVDNWDTHEGGRAIYLYV